MEGIQQTLGVFPQESEFAIGAFAESSFNDPFNSISIGFGDGAGPLIATRRRMPVASIHQRSEVGNADWNISIIPFPLVRLVKMIAGRLHSFVNLKGVIGQFGVIHTNEMDNPEGISLRQCRLLIESVEIPLCDPKAVFPFGEFC